MLRNTRENGNSRTATPPVVVGDRVDLVGDLSGDEGALARIVRVAERTSVLRRTADDTDPYERVVVANASHQVIVTALADPEPRTGFVDRCLVAAYAGGLAPVLCLTKADLADPGPFAAEYAELDLPVVVTRVGVEASAPAGSESDPTPLREIVDDRVSAMVGHSVVGKSTLVNALVPEAERAVGTVSGVGKGRHRSTSAVALPLPGHRGWVVDTPGVRSFGLAHIAPSDVVAAFDDLAVAIEDCPRGCSHPGPPADPECALDEAVLIVRLSSGRLIALRRILRRFGRPDSSWSADHRKDVTLSA